MVVNDTLTPSRVAALVGVGAHNIRRWCEWHKEHLSEGATPLPGAPRKLTVLDVEVLKTVKALRDQGLQTHDINERLSSMTFAVIDHGGDTAITEAPQTAQNSPEQTEGALMVYQAIETLTARLQTLEQNQATGQDVQTRLQSLENQRPTWRDTIIFVLVALIVGVMIGLSIWWFQ